MHSLHVRCCMPWCLLVTLVVLCSSHLVLASHSCSLTAVQFSSYTVTVSAESVSGSTPAARVTWSTTAPPQCVISVRVDFRTSSHGAVVATNTTTNTSQTEVMQTGLQCGTYYYITVVVTGEPGGTRSTVTGSAVQVLVGDIPAPVGVTPEATADNTSISVSWQWSRQGLSMCVGNVRVDYQPEGGSLLMYTAGSTVAATSATLLNLQCDTVYTVWVHASGGQTGKTSVSKTVSLPARAPPTPTNITAQFTSASSVRVTWRWSSSGPAPDCFHTTTVTYRPEGGGESSLQLRNPEAAAATLTDLQCNTNYTIAVVATAGEYRREGVAFLPLQGPHSLSAVVLSPASVRLTWVAPCHTQQYHIYYRGTCGAYVDEGRLETDRQEHMFDTLQEGINYTFTVNQSGFSGGRVFSIGPVYARTFTAVPSGAPQSLQGMFVQPSKASLRWREVPCVQQNGPITGYVVRYYATCGADRDMQGSKAEATSSIRIDGLTPNTEYAFQVAAVNVNGTGLFSEPIILGGAPQLVTVTAVNPTTVNVSWSEVQCFNGSGAVTHYLVQYQSMCGGAVQTVVTDGPIHETTVSGLTPNASLYTFQVAAVNNQTTGPFGNLVNSTPGTPSTCPTEDPVSLDLLAWAVAGVAVLAVVVLLVVAVIQSSVIWRSTSKTASESQRITEMTMKKCSAYAEVSYEGGQGEEPGAYEIP